MLYSTHRRWLGLQSFVSLQESDIMWTVENSKLWDWNLFAVLYPAYKQLFGLWVLENLTICWQLTIMLESPDHRHNNPASLQQSHDVASGIFSGPSTVLHCVAFWVGLQCDDQFTTPTTICHAFWGFISPDVILHNLLMTTALVNRIIVGGSYLQVPNPCGVCAYRVNFTAPSLKCSTINATYYNFSTNLPPTYKSGTWVPILNATVASGYTLTVATRDGVAPIMNPPVAVRCDAFRANYDVRVRHDNFSSHIDILNVTFGSRLSPSLGTQPDPLDLALDGLVQAFVNAFNGGVIFDAQYDGFVGTPPSVAYSPMMQWDPSPGKNSTLTWSNLTTSLPQLMQNISLSLLSGQFPSKNQTYLAKTQTECSMTMLIYEYNSSRLLAIYTVAWVAAAIFFSLGFLFVWKNGVEHNLDFSHVVDERHSYSQVPKDQYWAPRVTCHLDFVSYSYYQISHIIEVNRPLVLLRLCNHKDRHCIYHISQKADRF